MNWLYSLFSNDFMPHGHCYFWRPDILWTHVLGDGFIAFAYFCIPAILLFFLFKRRPQRIPFWWVLVLFAAFIYLCGVTHILGIITIWEPIYVIEGWLKVATALVSMVTAVVLIPLVPKALTLKSAEDLERANNALNSEIRQRDRIQKKLQHTNQELEEITSITAHDLQAPLRRMITYADVLKSRLAEHDESGRELVQLLESISSNGLQMRQHLDDVLAFSTISKEQAGNTRVDVRELVDGIVKALRKQLGEQGDFTCRIGQLPVMQAPRRVLYHVLYNLLDNAIKYRSPQRKLEIVIKAEPSSSPDGQAEWQFTVADNGIGIPAEQAGRVFKLFTRLHAKGDYPGSGIGLATVKKLLSAHGGRIWVEPNPRGGSCFHFTLPTQPAEPVA